MRAKFILMLASQISSSESQPAKNGRLMMKANHRGPGTRKGAADPEEARQLALSITQGELLRAGLITWASANLTPCTVSIKQEEGHDSAK